MAAAAPNGGSGGPAVDELDAIDTLDTLDALDTLHVRRLHAAAVLPQRATREAAGYDLHAVEALELEPGAARVVRTGLAIAIPPGLYGRIAGRSGLAVKQRIDVLAGVIDPDYRGELGVCLINHGTTAFHVHVGDRVGQLILERCATPRLVWSDALAETERGARGFGSTGSAALLPDGASMP